MEALTTASTCRVTALTTVGAASQRPVFPTSTSRTSVQCDCASRSPATMRSNGMSRAAE